jgi:hypothetical protein
MTIIGLLVSWIFTRIELSNNNNEIRNAYTNGTGVGSVARSNAIKSDLASSALSSGVYIDNKFVLRGKGYMTFANKNYFYDERYVNVMFWLSLCYSNIYSKQYRTFVCMKLMMVTYT